MSLSRCVFLTLLTIFTLLSLTVASLIGDGRTALGLAIIGAVVTISIAVVTYIIEQATK